MVSLLLIVGKDKVWDEGQGVVDVAEPRERLQAGCWRVVGWIGSVPT